MNVQRRITDFDIRGSSGANALALALRQIGVRRIFGTPGGRAGLDLVAALRTQGIRFIPTRDEGAAVIAAGVTGDLSGIPGVALVSQGRGLFNALAGLASAGRDRAPTIVICDRSHTGTHFAGEGHAIDACLMLPGLMKAHRSLSGEGVTEMLGALAAAALAAPCGPVLLDIGGEAAAMQVPFAPASRAVPLLATLSPSIDEVTENIARARRPVIVLGMETRSEPAAKAAKLLSESMHCPTFVTYKAKGVLADDHPLNCGVFTGGAAEAPIVSRADLVVLIGVEPAEVTPPGSWRTRGAVIEIAACDRAPCIEGGAPIVVEAIARAMETLAGSCVRSEWEDTIVPRHRDALRGALAYPGRRDSVGPQRVVEMALAAAEHRCQTPRVTVDAGAHMISATNFWCCARPNDLLISNGPMAGSFAVPAAIAAALHDPARPVIAFVGDGGLAGSLAELATAVSAGTRIIVIVFNDDSPSLVAARSGGRESAGDALAWQHIDFAQVMHGLGGRGRAVQTIDEYASALDEALSGDGPALIDVRIDPAGYHRQLRVVMG
jgi:acetolactate synthase-1/2/3 large subunit